MMKQRDDLFPLIYDFDTLHAAYLRARRGKRDHADVLRFERDLEGELIQLQNELVWGQYRTGPYRSFWVTEPKRRLVAALPFRDRVLQHALVGVLEPIWEPAFIFHSYACRPGKGMHAAVDVAQRWMRTVQRTSGNVYALKLDVRHYFPSIDHDILLALLADRISCQQTLNLCRSIIATWRPGLPIGNLTSQLCANIYLHQLDQFAKHALGVRRYARYMDDVLVIHHSKAYLHALRRQFEHYLAASLRLSVNRKTQVQPCGCVGAPGLDWLGYRLWTTHRRLRASSVSRMRRRLRYLVAAAATSKLSQPQITARVRSWIAHAEHADSWRIRERLLSAAVFRGPPSCPYQ